jgi:hypothetical protein
MDKFVFRKKDAKAPPAPNTNASDADLPPLKYTSLALVRTWSQILFGVSQVTGAHCWFRSALGCILGVTVFSPYVKTAACPKVKGVLTPTSQESQDEVMSVWSVCRSLKIPQFKDHSLVRPE